jgi:TldD protein
MMALVHGTLGAATQLDRAMGYEANATGTSYLGPHPLDLLGHTTLGSSLLNVTADRSMPKGLATVKWDDEGVEPDTFSLVENGEFVDYQTSREFAPVLTPWYQQRGRPVRSHGCATAESALFAPTIQTPNLTLVPGTSNATFDDLVANTQKGVALTNFIRMNMDFQSRNGAIACRKVEIVNGKLGATLTGGYVMFDASTIWKGLYALGGAPSQVTGMGSSGKGQPPQSALASVTVVPGSLHGVILVRNS